MIKKVLLEPSLTGHLLTYHLWLLSHGAEQSGQSPCGLQSLLSTIWPFMENVCGALALDVE